jgi:hypothetical protein
MTEPGGVLAATMTTVPTLLTTPTADATPYIFTSNIYDVGLRC